MRRKTETKIKGVLQDTQDPRTNCKIYDTGNIINSIIPVLYQSTVYCNLHAYIRLDYTIVLRIMIYPRYQQIVDNTVVLTIVSLKYTVPVEYSA
jgi:hypothetical protein